MRVFRLPDGGWVVDSETVVDDPTNGYLVSPEPAHRIVRLGVTGAVAEVTLETYSDCEYLGCIVLAVRETELLSTHWRGQEYSEPRRWDEVRATGLVEVPLAEFPYREAVEEALRRG